MKKINKKKIAVLYSGGRNFGGIETYIFNLFKNINKSEFHIELVSLGDWELTDRLRKSGYKVVVFDKKRINFGTIGSIGKYLQESNFNLLVSQATVANAYARAVSFIYKIPNLVTVHSDQAADYSNAVIRTIYGIIEKLSRFPTHSYLAVSEYIKNGLIKNGVNSKRITVIYNGLDFPTPKARPHKRLVIGSVGRLHPVKGFDLLIRAFSIMKNKRLRLRIAGSGNQIDGLKKIANDYGVSDRVEFVGFKENIYEFLDSIDVYAQTSLSEGFGLSVVEAMSQNIPVVVTPAGSLCEIVTDKKTGYICEDFTVESIAKSLSAAVSNYEQSKKIGESGRDYVVANFSVDDWIKNTEKVYRELC